MRRDGQLLGQANSDGAGEPSPGAPALAQDAAPAGPDQDTPSVSEEAGQAGRVRADRAPWLIALAVFAAYLPISVFRYLRFDPTSWDLGIFTEYVKQYAHLHAPIVNIRGPGFNLLGDHFHPIVALIAPFFRLFPTPVTLLAAQALLAAVSVVPVSRAAADKLGIGAGRAIGAAYGFSWGLQQMVNYDFHEIAFAVPLLACSLSSLIRGRTRAAVLWALPLVLVKEDQGFTIAAIGIVIALAYKRPRAGLLLTVWGLAWSLLAITVIIPHFSPTHSYLYWTDGGTVSPVGGHFSVAGVLSQLVAGASTKLPTLAMILLPTAFLALGSPLVLIAVPSLLLRFIGTNSNYWGTDWHYNATIMPIIFLAAIDAMARIRAARLASAAGITGTAATANAASAATSTTATSTAATADGDAAAVRSTGRAELDGADDAEGRRPRDPAHPVGLVGAAATRRPGSIVLGLERYGAAAMLAIAAALAFQYPLSQLWTPQTYSTGLHATAARAAMARVPDGATVATDLDLLAPLAARADTFWLGNFGSNPATTYIVFDTASTDWQPPPSNVLAFVESLNHGKHYRQIFVDDGIYVFIRSGP
jgi:uncharacterized membrane protein